jgi:hypothetical protein
MFRIVGRGAAQSTTDMGGAKVAHKSTKRGKIVEDDDDNIVELPPTMVEIVD